jgi:IS4 transposase
VFEGLLARCEAAAPARRRFRFKNKLVSLDSTVIELCAAVFDWAKYRRTKGAVKLHLLLDHDGFLPRVAVITDGKRADIQVARTLRFEPGTILVMDRGYVDYAWFGQLTTDGVVFVTRLKADAAYHVMETRQPPARSHVRRDEIIHLAGAQAAKACLHALRRVEVWDPVQEQVLVFLTNDGGLGATTVAAIYKDRWQVELFFKALKQNRKVKTFVGTSANALQAAVERVAEVLLTQMDTVTRPATRTAT